MILQINAIERKSVKQKRDQKVLEDLLILAEDVDISHSASRYRLAAAVVKKRQIMGLGVNKYKKTHPLQSVFKKHPLADYPCAEVGAIANAKRRFGEEALKGATIYVARLKYTDAEKTALTSGVASPCAGCRQHIKSFGIARIVYTTEDGSFTCEDTSK